MKKILYTILFFINTLSACEVCYGAHDDPITLGMNKAILFLLLTIVFVLSCISYGIISLVRRANQIKVEESK